MKPRVLYLMAVCTVLLSNAGWALDISVSKAGPVTSIQQAVDQIGEQGGVITITDSGTYEESILIGDDSANKGQPITITSNKTGNERPIISPLSAVGPFIEANKSERVANVAIMINGSKLSNVILEGNPDAEGATGNGACALFVLADDFVMENVLVRPRAGTNGTVLFPNSAVFLAQDGEGGVARSNGRTCTGTIIRNCEFLGVATDGTSEPTVDGSHCFLTSGENGQFATFVRTDHHTNSDNQNVVITVEKSTFKYSYDAGIFFSNRSGSRGKMTLNVRDCFFDAFGKFQVGCRGVWLNCERSIFSRACQGNHGDGENAAIRMQEQDGRIPDADISNCLFVNCGGEYAKKAYYGGVNNHNGGVVNVNHCTFDLCCSGVTLNDPKAQSVLNVSNCIFSRIGYNQAPAVDVAGSYPAIEEPYILWFSEKFDADAKISAVFNKFRDNPNGEFNVNNCIVFDIADEQADYLPGDDLPDGSVLAAGEITMNNVVRVDPQFANLELLSAKPYDLKADSPAIDIGVTALPALGTLDLDGTARLIGKAADLGAQEFGGTRVLDWPLQ